MNRGSWMDKTHEIVSLSNRSPSQAVVTLKRFFDIAVGSVGTGCYALSYPFISALIQLESRGPTVYSQIRVGVNKRLDSLDSSLSCIRKEDVGGRPFTIYKYRTMRNDAEILGPQLCVKGRDPRVTRIGNWLRRTHLDELPQFWNILKGEMSFIGPRPERPHFTIQYNEQIPHYRQRTLFTKPGLTGLAQIILGYDDDLDSVVRKSFFDLAYSASLSDLWGWIKMESWIVLHTFFYLGKRSQVGDGASGLPRKLERTLKLPFVGLHHREPLEMEAPRFSLRVQDRNHDFSFSRLSAAQLSVEMDRLPQQNHQKWEISLNPNARFDLEDFGFLVNLIHKVNANEGSLTIRNPHPHVRKMLRETQLHKIVHLENMSLSIPNFLTIDVECWFHAYNLNSKIPKSRWHLQTTRIQENMRRILDLLAQYQVHATFYVLGWVAERFPDIVRMIDDGGHEIGTHGQFHSLITDMTPDEFRYDLDRSLEALARLTNQPIHGYRGSNFTITRNTLWALQIMAERGIKYDSSIFPIGRERYGIPDYPCRMPHTLRVGNTTQLLEFPLSTLAIGKKLLPIAGGGYLRLYPYRVTDRYIEQLNRKGFPAMVYFHPWELDKEQIKLDVAPIKKFQHYVNLHTTEWKLSRLLERFQFTSIRDGLKSRRIQRMIAKNSVLLEIPESEQAALSFEMQTEHPHALAS